MKGTVTENEKPIGLVLHDARERSRATPAPPQSGNLYPPPFNYPTPIIVMPHLGVSGTQGHVGMQYGTPATMSNTVVAPWTGCGNFLSSRDTDLGRHIAQN